MDRVRYLLGLLTLGLALVGGIYLFRLLGDEDSRSYYQLNVEFRDARGLMPGADVRYRGVVVGSVRDVSLRDDGRRAFARLVLLPGRENLARTNTKFWIVTPRFGGLTTGASGLETLVRDAYLSFLTPDPWGPQLADGSAVLGVETPFADPRDAPIEPVRRGDLMMTLLIQENHGLEVGARVMFRGVQTGEVRSVQMAADGTHIEVGLRIARRYRATVTDKTRFWAARPRVSGALMSGFSLEDVSALISPFVGYYTAPGEGLPVAEGYRVAAEPERPDFETSPVPESALEVADAPEVRASEPAVRLVRISYAAVEEDWLSANDRVSREGTGVLFEDREGQLLVATTRTVCDASYFMRDTFGADPDISKEDIRVQLPEGPVLEALRSWVAVDGADLALLSVQTDAETRLSLATTPKALFAFDASGAPGAIELRELGAGAGHRPPVRLEGSGLPAVAEHRGAVAVKGGVVHGLLGQKSGTDATPVLVGIDGLPAALRPVK